MTREQAAQHAGAGTLAAAVLALEVAPIDMLADCSFAFSVTLDVQRSTIEKRMRRRERGQ